MSAGRRGGPEAPEAYFIRGASTGWTRSTELLPRAPADQLKSIFYDSTDLMNPLLPKPKGELIAGLLWRED